MADLSGTDIDRYHLIEPLGQGGMAIVYRAYDTRLERDVAVKLIRRNAFSPDVLERVLKRFDREAKSLAKLTHPNIVSIIDYGEFESSPYLVMPYLMGGTLKSLLGKPLPWQQVIALLLPIADALAYAHQKGIIHRDVKPGNILVTEGGAPMLTDFGIARLLENEDSQTLTGTGVGVGTPEYMSPEQGMGREVDGRSDIYSLGVVFYEMVTGRKPYTADTPMAVVLKQSTEPLPRPGQFVRDLPENVEKILYKSLAKNADDRYQSMAEFTNAMKQIKNTASEVVDLNNRAPYPSSEPETGETIDSLETRYASEPAVTRREAPGTVIPPYLAPTKTEKSSSAAGKIVGFSLAGVAGLVLIIGAISGWFSPRLKTPTPAPVMTEAPALTEPAVVEPQVLNVWSYTNELKTMAVAFEKLHPEVDVVYTMISMSNGEYQTKVLSSIGTDAAPDVLALEAAFVKEYVEDDFLANLNDLLPYAEAMQTYQATIDIGTYEDEVKAYAYQMTAGAYFYRRSLAMEYFGTDDPEVIQALVADMDKFVNTAELVAQKSGGNTYMIASSFDMAILFYANRNQPWIVNNTLVIDPMVEEWVATAKLFHDNGYEANAPAWTEGWFAGMNDSLIDSNGNPRQVFSYFLPTWGLPYVLSPNSASPMGTVFTAGDWAMVNGPMPYSWGGSWLGVMKDSQQLDLAKEFVRFCTLDEENLTKWATGVYTNEYLRSIDPSLDTDQSQSAGDFVSSRLVVEKVSSGFQNVYLSHFLSGQNYYAGFADAAPSVSNRLVQATDFTVESALVDPLNQYLVGNIPEEVMWDTWKSSLRDSMPDLIIVDSN